MVYLLTTQFGKRLTWTNALKGYVKAY